MILSSFTYCFPFLCYNNVVLYSVDDITNTEEEVKIKGDTSSLEDHPVDSEIKERENSTEYQIRFPNEQKVQTMADQEANGQVVAEGQAPAGQDGAEDEVPERPKKNQTPSEPPVTYREFNVSLRINKYSKLSENYNSTTRCLSFCH